MFLHISNYFFLKNKFFFIIAGVQSPERQKNTFLSQRHILAEIMYCIWYFQVDGDHSSSLRFEGLQRALLSVRDSRLVLQ